MASDNQNGNSSFNSDRSEATLDAQSSSNQRDSTFACISAQGDSSAELHALAVALNKFTSQQKLSSKDREAVSLLRRRAAIEREYFLAHQKALIDSLYRFVDVLWELFPNGRSSEISNRLEDCREELEQHGDLVFGPANRLKDLDDVLKQEERGLWHQDERTVFLTSKIAKSLDRLNVSLTDEEKAEADSEAAMSRYPYTPPLMLPKKQSHPLLEEYAVRYRELAKLKTDLMELDSDYWDEREQRNYDEDQDRPPATPEEEFEAIWRRKLTDLTNEAIRCRRELEAAEVVCIEAGIDPGQMTHEEEEHPREFSPRDSPKIAAGTALERHGLSFMGDGPLEIPVRGNLGGLANQASVSNSPASSRVEGWMDQLPEEALCAEQFEHDSTSIPEPKPDLPSPLMDTPKSLCRKHSWPSYFIGRSSNTTTMRLEPAQTELISGPCSDAQS